MGRVEVAHAYPGKSSRECYQACIRAAEAAGYSIFKKREIASLAICKGSIQDAPAELSLLVPLGSPTRVQLSLSSDRCGQEALMSESERLFRLLEVEITNARA